MSGNGSLVDVGDLRPIRLPANADPATNPDKRSGAIVVRDCTVADGHVLLGIGSELSGGVENIRLANCRVEGEVWRCLFVKTNPARGGYVRNVSVKGVRGRCAKCALFEIMPDYQWETRDKPQNLEAFSTGAFLSAAILSPDSLRAFSVW